MSIRREVREDSGQLSCWRPLPLKEGEKERALDELLRAARMVGRSFDRIEWVEPNSTVAGWVGYLS